MEQPLAPLPGLPFCRFKRWVVYVKEHGTRWCILRIDFRWTNSGEVVHSAICAMPSRPFQWNWTVSKVEEVALGSCVPGACLALGVVS